ncbi:MAG: hypothetical protein MUF06_09345, partial [Pirellulaceae bacterium]|nr:hypothetical protein [Pirellulaceae bacterium]
MNAAGIWLATWLAEFLTGATVLLAAAILVRAMFRQPAARVAVAWSTCVGILLLAVLLAWRDRPRVALVDVASRWRAAEPAVSAEPPSARYSDPSPVAALPSIVETDTAVIAESITMTPDVETAVAVNADNRGVVSRPRLFAP